MIPPFFAKRTGKAAMIPNATRSGFAGLVKLAAAAHAQAIAMALIARDLEAARSVQLRLLDHCEAAASQIRFAVDRAPGADEASQILAEADGARLVRGLTGLRNDPRHCQTGARTRAKRSIMISTRW